jgi:transposase
VWATFARAPDPEQARGILRESGVRVEDDPGRAVYPLARRASGRPPKLALRSLQQVARVLLKGAKAAGFATDLWTCPRIAQVIACRFGVQYHVDHLGRLLRALDWSPQKPQRQTVERDALNPIE